MLEKVIEGTAQEPALINGGSAQARQECDNSHRKHIQIREDAGISHIKLIQAELIRKNGFEIIIHKAGTLK